MFVKIPQTFKVCHFKPCNGQEVQMYVLKNNHQEMFPIVRFCLSLKHTNSIQDRWVRTVTDTSHNRKHKAEVERS